MSQLVNLVRIMACKYTDGCKLMIKSGSSEREQRAMRDLLAYLNDQIEGPDGLDFAKLQKDSPEQFSNPAECCLFQSDYRKEKATQN